MPIEALYGQGKTADQVSQALATQLDTVPEPERIAFVETVAITLGIPERGQPKGDQALRNGRHSVLTLMWIPPPATSEAQTSTPEPVSTSAGTSPAPAPVNPEAAKPNANNLASVDDSSREIRDPLQ
ncbi:hypothetical protein [Pseudomonas cerasi]|uniref:hypothetical protein n=1 Tax=Pseudomonas cerasi TaxID=1583341 RepID=UPI0007F9C458|nr:hypothetical protein PCPL58_p3003 [Pseudomonas cerasi]